MNEIFKKNSDQSFIEELVLITAKRATKNPTIRDVQIVCVMIRNY